MGEKIKYKVCKNCKEKYLPKMPLQQVCSVKCALELEYKRNKAKNEKESKQNIAKIKESLKTKKDYLNELQKVFNTYIRIRDKDKPCISCGCSLLNIKYDAGHYYCVGLYPELRFDEDNVHGQCTYCNKHNHGNLLAYAANLPDRIGINRFLALNDRINIERHYSISELKELIVKYKQLIKINYGKAT